MNKFDLIIFDLDGTLLDTSEGISAAVRFTVDSFGLSSLSEETLRSFIGPPIQKSFSRVYRVPQETADQYAAVFRNRYKDHDLMKAVPYEGMIDTLKALGAAGCRLAVATYKREDYALKLLDGFSLLELFDAAHGSDAAGEKTKADIIQTCIDELQLHDKSRIALVGDTDSDRVGAESVGIHFIGASYGFGFRPGDEEALPGVRIDAPSDLIRLVLSDA